MKIYKGVLIIVCCFLLLGCQDNSNNRANRTPTDLDSDTEVETNEKTDKKEIADYKRDTNPGEVINITMDQMEEMIEKKETFVVSFVTTYCMYCRQLHSILDEYLKTHIPAIRMIRPQASYLIFLDCRGMGVSQKELVDFFVDGAHLALNDGAMFGKEGEGFMRLNVACPRSVLRQALDQIKEAYELKHDTIA